MLVDVRGCQTMLTARDLTLTTKSGSFLRGRCCQLFLSVVGLEAFLLSVYWIVQAVVFAVEQVWEP